jgi:hypothetical protein
MCTHATVDAYLHMLLFNYIYFVLPRAVRFDWHILYLLPLHVFSLHVSHGQLDGL